MIVKPHNNAVLPAAAITVRIAREALAENGLDANLVTLMATDNRADTTALAKHPAVRSDRLHRRQCLRQLAHRQLPPGAGSRRTRRRNNIVIDSTDNYKGMLQQPRLHALALFRPDVHNDAGHLRAGGRHRHAGWKGAFDQVAGDPLPRPRNSSDPAVATAVLGAIQSDDTLARIASASQWGEVVLASKKIEHPEFPKAEVRTLCC